MRRGGMAELAVLGLLVVACSSGQPGAGTSASDPTGTTRPVSTAPAPEPVSGSTAEMATDTTDLAGAAGEPTTNPAELFLRTPGRLDVVVELDETTSTTTAVGPEGGVLELTVDGVAIALEVPAGAMVDERAITMTAIAAIDGFPTDGGLVAGVHLEPDGLAFLAPARLSVPIPDEVPLDELIGFEYAARGDDLHQTLMVIEERTAVFPVLHFSGRALGRGSNGRADGGGTASGRSPEQACNAARERFNEVVWGGIECTAQGCWAELGDAEVGNLDRLLREWYTRSVLPKLQEAAVEPLVLSCSLMQWLEWRQAVAGLFPALNPDNTFSATYASESASEALTELVEQSAEEAGNAIVGAYRTSQDRCVAGRFDHAFVMMDVGATAEMFGDTVVIRGERPSSSEAQQDAQRCLTFRVDLVSTIELGGEVPYDGTATAGVEVAPDLTTGTWSGSGPIRLSGLRLANTLSDPCVKDFTAKSGTMTCERLVLPGLLEEPSYPECNSCGGAGPVPDGGRDDTSDTGDTGDDVSLQFSPGLPREVQVTQCPDALPPELLHNLWTTFFGILHVNEVVSGDIEGEYSLLFEDFEVPGDRLYAKTTSTLSRTDSGAKLSEDTEIEIWHTPQR